MSIAAPSQLDWQVCQLCRGSWQLRAATRPRWKLPWCPLQGQKDLWHGTQRCERWKGRCLLHETSPQLFASEQVPLHRAGTGLLPLATSPGRTQEDSELCPMESCCIQNLLKNTRQFQREDMFWLKFFARRLPTNSDYNKSFQNSRVPSVLSCSANLLHGLSFKLSWAIAWLTFFFC